MLCRVWLIFVIVLSVAGEAADSARIAWTKDYVSGLDIGLIDPVQVDHRTFTRAGVVIAEVGRKDLLAGPVYNWKIISGRLRFGGEVGDKDFDEWTLLFRSHTKIVVRKRNGKVSTYRFRKRKPNRQRLGSAGFVA